MAQINKWWTLCALSLCSVVWLGSCRRHRGADDAQPELFIFSELCALKDEAGPCKAIKDRFFFNIDTGRCEQFEYGGCGGNANNFETLEACEEMCVVSADKNPCHLDEAPGPCRGLVMRYFFDRKSQECKKFFYGGCFGNANNFRTMAACQAKCQKPVKTTNAPEVHTHSARKVHVALPTIASEELTLIQAQVQRNQTKPEPTDFTPPEFCVAPVDRGSCDGDERRFAYNPKTKRCHMFRYSGCGGNSNNFSHRRHCIKKCMNVRSKDLGRKMIRIRKKNIRNIAFRSL